MRVALFSLCLWLLAACGDAGDLKFKGSDISGTKLGQNWTLVGMDGKTYTPESFRGKVTLVFFGFTQCPDVCPTALAELSQVMKLLGDRASQVQVVMISVDPERDTPEVLRAYVSGFDPRFIGMTGTAEQIKAAAGSFKAYYAKVPAAKGSYTMDHSSSFYLLDKKGEARVMLNSTIGASAVAQDIETLLR
ncbi:SCO family protein [Zwartia vadi]|uniref:SCO family protein n=1 Tax=Zwartia vadi TaxID=3058168 RepID=UPI0025B3D557|nr:SCO family protein [Zwartia vadi]MDN3987756.1 SCO family protein [Zwartia vadi]